MNKNRYRWIIKALNNYFIFFILVAFVITCCTMLFVSSLSESLGVTLTSENIGEAAKLTFLNVALITLVLTVVDGFRRKFTVERPVRQISEAAEKMASGDFSVRVPRVTKFGTDEHFNEIIESINKVAEELSGVETLRTDFIANVSHEMKTPLAVIQNYGTLLGESNLTESKRIEYAKTITEASRRLSDMMTNILRLNRLENQKIYPTVTSYNLTEQLCECLLTYESVWDKKEIEIEAMLDEDVFIDADRELLSLVWNNLLSNAFKFTEKHGKVTVTITEQDGYATVKISDTGCGISKEVGKHIFEKFYQGDTSHATEGCGLGLALVKRVVDIIGGEICADSEVGIGTTFEVKIKTSSSKSV